MANGLKYSIPRQISESVGYFYDNLDRLAAPDYEPTQQDILYCRKTTKGIHEFDMEIEGVPFKFVDVGGQRTQRQRWFQVTNTNQRPFGIFDHFVSY